MKYGIYYAYWEKEWAADYIPYIEKAAKLGFSLISNHAFVDGNKRIGVFAMLMTLQLNNIKIKYTQSELISLGLSVADGKTEYIDILDWIMEHKIED